MPKLLRKSIYGTSIISFLCCVVLTSVNFIRLSNNAEFCGVFNGLNLLLLIFSSSNIESKFNYVLPDYIFIAPYSKEQRKKLIRKSLLYNFIAAYSCILVLAICPMIIYAVLNGEVMKLTLCFTEIIIVFTMVYSGKYMKYTYEVNLNMGVFLSGVRFFQYIMFAGMSGSMSHITIIGTIIFFTIIIAGIIVILICRKKYYEPMVEYLADYERSREINKKRNQTI